MQKKKTLYFITESYNGNKVFFYNELVELSKIYDIRFVSANGYEEIESEVQNIKYFYFDNQIGKAKKILYAVKYIFDSRCRAESRDIINSKQRCFFRFFRSVEYFAIAEEFYKWFIDNVYIDGGESIYYTYWASYYALSMMLHRREHNNMKCITRLHGFDLYDNQNDAGRQPFRRILNMNEDRLVFVSKCSLDYYTDKYKECVSDKVILNRLGTKRAFYDISTDFSADIDTVFTLVSCSSVYALKRVNLIVQAISLLDIPIRWIHFGDGVLFEDIKKLVTTNLNEKDNVNCILMGSVSNDIVLQYYQENRVDAFINVSYSEGCPMSIMEAMSYGIPIIATDVGEAPILTSGNGVLLESNPSAESVAKAISDIYILKEENEEVYKLMRSKSLTKWKELFNVERNIEDFISVLEGL